ncbi:MAG: PPC domain-containing protein [Planctomycetes bacterium]|nr:PPC domain-containing protein [Planctomycetota bacterium]
MRMHAKGFVFAVAVLALASIGYSDGPIDLTDGVPVGGLAGATGSEVDYRIVVPPGQGELEISISGGTGDCDLYVRRDGPPTFTGYDYRPYLFGNNETVVIDDPASGNWYIMLRARAAYTGVTLVADYEDASPTMLTNGVPEDDISGGKYTEKLFAIDVPAGQSELEVRTWGGFGNLDLTVKRGSAPSLFDFDDRSFGGGTNESVSITDPEAGTWYIVLHASSHYQHVTLRATYGSGSASATTLEDEVPITGLSDTAGGESTFVIYVPRDQDGLEFAIFGGTGDCDMYIKRGAVPTTSNYDYRPSDSGNNESINIGSPRSGNWYVLLVADSSYSGVTLEANYYRSDKPDQPDEKVTRLTAGVPVPNLAGKAGSEQFFSIEVPDSVKSLEIKMSGGSGDADLYVRKGMLPTTSQYDYRPYLTGSNEQVTISKSPAGTWFILVRGYQAFSGVTLVATFDGVAGEGIPILLNGVPVPDLAGAIASQTFFKIEIPTGQTKLEFAMSGGTGDADLYVRLGAKPTKQDWDYRPFVIGNNETVTIDDPKAGTYYVMIRAYMAYTGVTLKATHGPVPAEETKALGLSGAVDSEWFFKVEVPAGQDHLKIQMSGGTGDADLYVKKGEKPSAKSWDYHPSLHGNDEMVEIQNPAAATWYILVRGYQAFAGVSLEACFKPAAKDDCDDCVIIIGAK